MADPSSIALLDLLPSWERHARSKRLADRTIYLYRNAAERLNAWLVAGGRPTAVDRIRREDLEHYFIAMREDGLGDYTIGMHYRSLRALFNWFEREDEVERSPFARMSEPKVDEKPVPVFTPEELTALLEACRGKAFEDRRDRAIVSLFIDSGPRLGELVGLRVDCLAKSKSAGGNSPARAVSHPSRIMGAACYRATSPAEKAPPVPRR